MDSLPSIHDGDGRCISEFEEHTVQCMLAVGDMKAILSRLFGQQIMDELINRAGM